VEKQKQQPMNDSGPKQQQLSTGVSTEYNKVFIIFYTGNPRPKGQKRERERK
jgi:hypothetical protein